MSATFPLLSPEAPGSTFVQTALTLLAQTSKNGTKSSDLKNAWFIVDIILSACYFPLIPASLFFIVHLFYIMKKKVFLSMRFHIVIFCLLSVILGIASNIVKSLPNAFDNVHLWKSAYTIELFGLVFFFNANLRLVQFWATLYHQTWTSGDINIVKRRLFVVSTIIFVLVNAAAVIGSILLIIFTGDGTRFWFQIIISGYSTVISAILFIGFLIYGFMLICNYKKAPHSKTSTLRKFTFLTGICTSSFLLVAVANVIQVVILSIGERTGLIAVPITYCVVYVLLLIGPTWMLLFFFGINKKEIICVRRKQKMKKKRRNTKTQKYTAEDAEEERRMEMEKRKKKQSMFITSMSGTPLEGLDDTPTPAAADEPPKKGVTFAALSEST